MGFLEPAYGGGSLGDVLPAVARALGSTALEEVAADTGRRSVPDPLRLPAAAAYVVMLVDGLGAELLAEHPDDAPFLHALLAPGRTITAGVPSTTATSLTSLGTALTPGQHGLVGYTSRIPGTDRLLNALQWDEAVDPRQWQPHETAFARLARAGVRATVVSKREFTGSGLTRCSQRGAELVGADQDEERLAAAVAASDPRHGPSVTYVYDGDVDGAGHRHGVDSAMWRAQVGAVDEWAERLRETLDPDTRLLVVADHGMVDSPAGSRIDVDEHPHLRRGVRLLGGEARFRHLYCAAGAVATVTAAWREELGDRAEVLTRDEAVDRGWFGTVDPGVRPRLGDVVVAARDDVAVMSSVDFGYETTLIGLHGSLTPREMLIPLLLA